MLPVLLVKSQSFGIRKIVDTNLSKSKAVLGNIKY